MDLIKIIQFCLIYDLLRHPHLWVVAMNGWGQVDLKLEQDFLWRHFKSLKSNKSWRSIMDIYWRFYKPLTYGLFFGMWLPWLGISWGAILNFAITHVVCCQRHRLIFYNPCSICYRIFQVFFYKAQFLGGRIAPKKPEVSDYMWLTKKELSKYVNTAYKRKLNTFIMEL